MESGRKAFIFFWFIENFSYCWHDNGEGLISPTFAAEGLERTTWNLWLCPRGRRKKDKGHVSVFLSRSVSDDGPEKVSISREMSALAADGSPFKSSKFECAFDKSGVGYGPTEFLERDDILFQKKEHCLPQDTLSLRCKIWQRDSNCHKVAPVCARTRIGIEKISFLHVVENFSTLEPNQRHTIRVPSDLKKENFGSSSLYFTCDSCREGNIVVHIHSFDGNHILCHIKISLLDGSGNIIECGRDDNRQDDERRDISKQLLSLKRQDILDNNSEYLPDGKLSLLCECTFSAGLEFQKLEVTQCEMSVVAERRATNVKFTVKAFAYPNVAKDVKKLYVNQCLTNVELKTKAKSFPAHKIVLFIRSPVFQAMVSNDTGDKNGDYILVDDLEEDVVQKFLLFLYSDTVEDLDWKLATQLYCAAVKYEVDVLRKSCSSFLLKNLIPIRAGELLLLADTHGDTHLKKSVEDFILRREEEVFGSDEWEKLMETNPMLVIKAMLLKYKIKKELNK